MTVNRKMVLIILYNLFLWILSMIVCILALITNQIEIINKIIVILLFVILIIAIGKLALIRNLKILIFLFTRLCNKHILKKEENKIVAILKKYEYDEIHMMTRGIDTLKPRINYCYCVCKWKNDVDKKTYEFKSGFYKEKISLLKKGERIIVYIDKKNPKRYYVDIEATIKELGV